jgi:Na+/proline symporter
MEIPQPSLHFLDYLIVCLYLVFALGVGFVLSKKASKGAEAYFLGGRSLPWWAIGISMVATSFASDTPLFVTEVVREHGLQRLWWILAWVNMLVVSARFNRTYTNVTRISFHEKSSDYYSRKIRETLS